MNKILSSPRFWQLFIVGISVGLIVAMPDVVWVKAFSAMCGFWFGGSVVVGTVDRNADKRVQAAEASGKMTTVSMPASVSEVSAKQE